MPYYKLLKKLIKKNGYTQKQVIDKCKELGLTKGLDKTYLCKLINNKLPPPSEEVSRTLAKVFNVDERLLVIEGYLDKAPKEIQEAFNALKLSTTLSSMIMFENKLTKAQLEEFKQECESQTTTEFIIELLDKNDYIINPKKYGFELQSKNDNCIINLKQPLGFKVSDNAMSPIINENDELILEIKSKYEDDDIIYFKYKNSGTPTARQVVMLGNDMKLIPFNNSYPSKLVHNNDIIIFGKVKKIIREI